MVDDDEDDIYVDGPMYESTVRPPQSPYDPNAGDRRPVDASGGGDHHGRRRHKSPATSCFAQPGTLAGKKNIT